eukprot:1558326-Amphidinium_carterae.1
MLLTLSLRSRLRTLIRLDLMTVGVHEDEPVPDDVIPKATPPSQAERLLALKLVYGKGPN